MQFPSRAGRLALLLLGVTLGPILLVLPVALWLGWTLNPVQNFYLGTYSACSVGANIPGNLTAVRWAEKIAPGRIPEPLLPADTVRSLDPKSPLALSSTAIAEGWRGVSITPTQKVRSAELKTYLQTAIYDDRSILWLFGMPMLYALAGVLILRVLWIFLAQRSGRKLAERHGRRTKGPELFEEFAWLRSRNADGVSFQLRFEHPALRWLPFGPSFRIPKRLESSHILLLGDTGSGKSSAIRQLLRQVQERGESAIVYDPAMDFVGEFYNPERGDLILNPLDARCPYWNMGDEISSVEFATAMAAALFPEKEYEKEFFTNAPRRVFTHLMRHRPNVQMLYQWMCDPAEIESRVKGTPYAAYLDPGAPAQRSGVLSSFNMIADSLELMYEPNPSAGSFSTSEWAYNRKRWVFLTSKSSAREKLLPLHSVWLDLFILRMMEPCENPAKPVWFVLDELASLNKLPQLHTAVTENRKYGNPVVLGFQGRSQLEKRYGQDAEAMLSQPATKIFFKTSEPRAAKWISDAIGEIEVERLKESRSVGLIGSKKSYAMEIATKPLIMASEISGLEPLRGFIKQENRVVPVHFQLAKKRGGQPEFIARTLPQPVARPSSAMLPTLSPKKLAAAVPSKPATTETTLPLFNQPDAKREEFVWDESNEIE
jgi:hypothetical protein